MRLKTLRLVRRADKLRGRTSVSGIGKTGPTLSFSASGENTLTETFVEFQTRWVLRSDGPLEMAGAVANSLQEMREILRGAVVKCAKDPDARAPLARMEEACARFLQTNPKIDRRDFTKRIDDDELDALFSVRLEFGEALADVIDRYGLSAAQELLNLIELARPQTPWLPPAEIN
jgi:hypothetical protein